MSTLLSTNQPGRVWGRKHALFTLVPCVFNPSLCLMLNNPAVLKILEHEKKRVEDLLLHVSEGRRKGQELSLRISKYRIFSFNLSLFFQRLFVVTCILCYVSKSETQQMSLQCESVESGFISYLNPRNFKSCSSPPFIERFFRGK